MLYIWTSINSYPQTHAATVYYFNLSLLMRYWMKIHCHVILLSNFLLLFVLHDICWKHLSSLIITCTFCVPFFFWFLIHEDDLIYISEARARARRNDVFLLHFSWDRSHVYFPLMSINNVRRLPMWLAFPMAICYERELTGKHLMEFKDLENVLNFCII